MSCNPHKPGDAGTLKSLPDPEAAPNRRLGRALSRRAAPPDKILLVRFSALGDVIQTLPILTMLREGFPQAKIGWAIDSELAPAIEGHPALDHIHRCSRLSWMRALSHPAKWPAAAREFQAFVHEVRSVGYDVAIDAQGLFKTALLPYMAGIRRRIGYRHGREFSSVFYSERYLKRGEYFDPSVCHLEHMAHLAYNVGAAEVRYAIEPPRLTARARQRVAELLDGAFSNGGPVVAMAPATQWVSKHWPEEYWVALIAQLVAETNLNLVVQGAAADAPVGARILQALPQSQLAGRVANLFGKLPIAEMYALYERVDAAVGSDSAPLHMAGAMRVPVLVGIYGPTGYRRTPPIGSPHIRLLSSEGELACQPCHKRSCPLRTDECMKRVRPEEVFQVLTDALTEAGISFQMNGAATVR
nr:glycosyltransferase family 9 protein [Candidatus Binatia bacterium]